MSGEDLALGEDGDGNVMLTECCVLLKDTWPTNMAPLLTSVQDEKGEA